MGEERCGKTVWRREAREATQLGHEEIEVEEKVLRLEEKRWEKAKRFVEKTRKTNFF